MAEIIEWQPNPHGYAHVICIDCRGTEFRVRVEDTDDGGQEFHSIICVGCGNEIFVQLKPVWGPR